MQLFSRKKAKTLKIGLKSKKKGKKKTKKTGSTLFVEETTTPQDKETTEQIASSTPSRITSIFEKGMTLQEDRLEILSKGLTEGLDFFQKYNEDRLQVAFEAFSEDMKKALYEVLFFLHVNDPKFSAIKYTAIRQERIYGIVREHEYEAVANLYLEGAPHGVQGIENLSKIFSEKFAEYLHSTFQESPPVAHVERVSPFVSIASLGSVGTIGHKPIASDLDLQVQYELFPFRIDVTSWEDQELVKVLRTEMKIWMNRVRIKRGLSSEALRDSKVLEELQKIARIQVNKSYPYLYKYLIEKKEDYRAELSTPDGLNIRQALLHEMMELLRKHAQRTEAQQKEQHTLLKQRANALQEYIQNKFPKAEIYLFVCDNDSYRKGKHGTTLESKEASGSAYELLLTFEVLMPGIQFTPMIPTHFILPKMINDSPTFYERTIDYIRFGMVPIYHEITDQLVDLGSAPALSLDYVLAHGGAVYWECFKAASGNLAKALLNLLRIEMLHSPKYLITIIELMKAPHLLNEFISIPSKGEPKAKDYGLLPWELLEMEEKQPLLCKDPWWTKYKALKIAFGELKYLRETERMRISRIIDLCFGLHVKVSHAFSKPGKKVLQETYREKFLVNMLERAFPNGSNELKKLKHITIGETQAVIQFEEEMKSLFKASMHRITTIQSKQQIPHESNQQEFQIWYHYYQNNFEPPSNMLRKSILHHLKIPRLRLQGGYDNVSNCWLFRSLQTEGKLGKRFDTFDQLEILPDEVDLIWCNSFLEGLADCILNSYYGYVNQGSLKEQKTVFEFDAVSMSIPDPLDSNHAYLRPDQVQRIADSITEFFPYFTYHYLDCVNVPRYYIDVYFFLHVMQFGRLSILYRDNLNNWYLDEFKVTDLRKKGKELVSEVKSTFKSKELHQTIDQFLTEKELDLKNPKLRTKFWLNPNSATTKHSVHKVKQKEADLAEIFRNSIYKYHTSSTQRW